MRSTLVSMKVKFLLITLLMLLAFPTHEAHAYLNPGDSSFIVQLLAGFVLSSIFFIKLAFQKIFRRGHKVADSPQKRDDL